MKKQLVVDANVVLRWFVAENETFLDQALALLQSLEKEKIQVWAPTFLLVEVINILVRKKQLPGSVTQEIIEKIKELKIGFVSLEKSDTKTLVYLCEKYQLSTYDALYLLTAKKKKCFLVTTDAELLKIKDTCIPLTGLKINR